jgi:nitroimidazol reductase NimA-like FMN-containing flavoprotein (pyridoxamine 5'-phosphate oxidase superfamily)
VEYPKTKQNTIKRGNKKAHYDKKTIYQILDNNEICSVAFTMDNLAMSQPINYGRNGDKIYLHGHKKNKMTETIIQNGKVSLSVFQLDGMRLTRSAYNHSVNFRSAIIFGDVKELTTDEEKLIGLECIINHFVKDRWNHCRIPNSKELNATRVIEITITQASAKIANARAIDSDKNDYDLDYWAGVIPVSTCYGQPINDEELKKDVKIPSHILDFYHNHQQIKE